MPPYKQPVCPQQLFRAEFTKMYGCFLSMKYGASMGDENFLNEPKIAKTENNI
jgi:hypothetical protein